LVTVLTYKVKTDKEFSDQELDNRLFILGELIINEVKTLIRRMMLVESGAYLQGWFSKVSSGSLVIENTQPYALYLEYGTYEYHNIFGDEDFPEVTQPKKKDLKQFGISTAGLPKGIQPFAPVRRVLYNDDLMSRLLAKVFS